MYLSTVGVRPWIFKHFQETGNYENAGNARNTEKYADKCLLGCRSFNRVKK